jgi:hypothetical protein
MDCGELCGIPRPSRMSDTIAKVRIGGFLRATEDLRAGSERTMQG